MVDQQRITVPTRTAESRWHVEDDLPYFLVARSSIISHHQKESLCDQMTTSKMEGPQVVLINLQTVGSSCN